QATCGTSNSAPDVWYSYTPPSDLTLTLDTCQATSYDTVLSIYSGTCGNMVEVACNDDAGANGPCPMISHSYLTAALTAGTPYLIRVAGYGGGSGTFRLHVAASYVNDACANATTISNGTYSGSTIFASNDGNVPCGNSASSPDVWYRYVPACNTNLV